MKPILIILLMLYTSTAFAKRIRPEIQNQIDTIAKCNELQYETVDMGSPSEQYKHYEKLRDSASIEELKTLLKNTNSVVKAYAGWALADRKYPFLSDIFAEFLATDEMVHYQRVCIGGDFHIASTLYFRIQSQGHLFEITDQDSIFFQSQIAKMDSLLLYSDKDVFVMIYALENNKANPKTYDRIKKLAEVEWNTNPLIALAKYRNKEDIPFFISQGKESFEAISYFPDEGFWNFLLSFKSEEKSLDYFIALSSFQDTAALNVLSEIYHSCTLEQITNLDKALIKNYCPLYKDMILKIWEEKKTIDYTITQKFIAQNPEKASESFVKGLLSDDKFNLIEIDYNYGTDELILPLMLQTIAIHDAEKLITICNKNVLSADFLELKPFLDCIESNHLSKTTDNLLSRLRVNTTKYDIFHIANTLLSFKYSETNISLKEIMQQRKSIWDSGTWSESIRELLEKHGIGIE